MSKRYAVFEPFVYDRLRNTLSHESSVLPLTPKALELLALFLERPGEVLTKDFVLETLWPGEIVHEGNIAQQIYLLRKALGACRAGDVVQTIPRRGYRFAAAVAQTDDLGAVPAGRSKAEPGRDAKRSPVRILAGSMVAAAALALAFGLARIERPIAPSSPETALGPLAARDYLLGRYYYDKPPFKELALARADFGEVVRLAPRSALGYAGEADVEFRLAEFDLRHRAAHVAAGRDLALRALQIDPSSSQAHATLGCWLDWFARSPAGAAREFDRAIALDPTNALARQWLGILDLYSGDFPASLAQLRQANLLDPTSFVISRWLGFAYYYSGHYAAAVGQFRQTLTLHRSDNLSRLHLAMALEQSGNPRQALAILEHLSPAHFSPPELRTWIAYCRALEGQRGAALAEADRIVHSPEVKLVPPTSLAAVYVAAGLPRRAVALLSAAHDNVMTMYTKANDSSALVPRYDPRLAVLYQDGRLGN